MSLRNLVVALFALVVSLSASAFMPAGGLWVVNSEAHGKPGRGFTIEVENEFIVFTYYGYRHDGTAVFYQAAGPVANNTFSAVLQEYADGTFLGGSTVDAHATGGPGTVSMTFYSGLNGTITLPGEGPKAISKFEFGYSTDPRSLLGTWLMVVPALGTVVGNYETLTTVGAASSTGTGTVVNAARNFVCENEISGAVAGDTICSEMPIQAGSMIYEFRMAGDRGEGQGGASDAVSGSPAFILRTATASGTGTGVNDGLDSQLGPGVLRAVRRLNAVPLGATATLPIRPDHLSQGEWQALQAWGQEVSQMPAVVH
jgi:hypothetical protein